MRRLSDIICNRHPLTMPASANVQDACEHMRKRRCGSILVTNGEGKLIGIFTGRDAVCRVLAAGKSGVSTTIGEVMTHKPVTLAPNKTAIEALRMMWEGGFRHLPVMDEGELLGIVSRGDFKGHEKDRLDEERDLWEHMR